MVDRCTTLVARRKACRNSLISNIGQQPHEKWRLGPKGVPGKAWEPEMVFEFQDPILRIYMVPVQSPEFDRGSERMVTESPLNIFHNCTCVSEAARILSPKPSLPVSRGAILASGLPPSWRKSAERWHWRKNRESPRTNLMECRRGSGATALLKSKPPTHRYPSYGLLATIRAISDADRPQTQTGEDNADVYFWGGGDCIHGPPPFGSVPRQHENPIQGGATCC
jgi:hypothetical protein